MNIIVNFTPKMLSFFMKFSKMSKNRCNLICPIFFEPWIEHANLKPNYELVGHHYCLFFSVSFLGSFASSPPPFRFPTSLGLSWSCLYWYSLRGPRSPQQYKGGQEPVHQESELVSCSAGWNVKRYQIGMIFIRILIVNLEPRKWTWN